MKSLSMDRNLVMQNSTDPHIGAVPFLTHIHDTRIDVCHSIDFHPTPI